MSQCVTQVQSHGHRASAVDLYSLTVELGLQAFDCTFGELEELAVGLALGQGCAKHTSLLVEGEDVVVVFIHVVHD